ncbi:hypothetical protein [Mesorhizobium sp. SP-1A]|uniref:hypothetical protein n=1 Tax=Mesorhizobium sp. SP-1A TaxID=3077840 RepID=UPI0028F71C89|nr:hypothetical protein [Mesorhizobium sp. SP-1A]
MANAEKLQDFIDVRRKLAQNEVKEFAAENDDVIVCFVQAGEYGMKVFRSLSSLSLSEYFWHLLKSRLVAIGFLIFMASAFLVAAYNEPDAAVRHTGQLYFSGMIVLFLGVLVADGRLKYRWFKQHGFDLEQFDDIFAAAVRVVGVGEKYLYSLKLEPNADKYLRGEVVLSVDPYSDISVVDVKSLPGRQSLLLSGVEIGADHVQDPVLATEVEAFGFANIHDVAEWMRIRIPQRDVVLEV